MTKQTYAYKKENSILNGLVDDYSLELEEYAAVYSFFVTYSLGDGQSAKGRSFGSYGWEGDYAHNGLKKALKGVIDLYDNSIAYFANENDSTGTFKSECGRLCLPDGVLTNCESERMAVSNTKGSNRYLQLFYRVRDGFAHGKYALKLSEDRVKMVIIQDDDSRNVTARIVIKLDTLLRLIRVVDVNNKLYF